MLRCILVVACTLSAITGAAADVTPLPDTPYEQVVADRYLFAGNGAECTAWPVLDQLESAWAVVAPPANATFATTGAWVLGMATGPSPQVALFWLDIGARSLTLVEGVVPATPNDLLLGVAGTAAGGSLSFDALLLSTSSIQFLQCSGVDGSTCVVLKEAELSADFGVVHAAMMVDVVGMAGSVYIACDTGLHLLDLSSLEVETNLNGITEPVRALAFTQAHQVAFTGTDTRLYIQTLPTANTAAVDASADMEAQSARWRYEEVNGLIDSPITSLAYDTTGDRLWIGQQQGVTRLFPVTMADGEVHWAFQRLDGFVSDPGSDVGGLPYENITTAAFPAAPAASGANDGRVWLGGAYGLMRYDALAANPADAWRVFNSARYMPQRDSVVNVTALAVLSRDPAAPAILGNTAIGVTAKGLAVIRFEMWTLVQKADWYQTYMDTPGRHEKYGLIGDCQTPLFGDTTQCKHHANDNGGLWTSIYLSGATWRYAVTGLQSDFDLAWAAFEALVFLNNITGIAGFPSRSLARLGDFPSDPHWHPSPTNAGWQFKGDTSSDEITGHEMIYGVVADLLAQTPEQRETALELMLAILENIQSHDWYLFGEHHNRTTWGVWNPDQINGDSNWQEGRGPNSIQILSWLAQALVSTGGDSNSTWLAGLTSLTTEPTRYDANLVNQKMVARCDSNFSDDELSYLAYLTMRRALDQWTTRTKDTEARSKLTSSSSSSSSRSSKKRRGKKSADQLVSDQLSNLESYMLAGLELSHRYKVREKSPWYNTLYCVASGQVQEPAARATGPLARRKNGNHKEHDKTSHGPLASSASASTASAPSSSSSSPPLPFAFDCGSLSVDSVWYLRRWPLELLSWPQSNSNRLDVQIGPGSGCRGGLQSLVALPPDERTQVKWNTGPFELDTGSGFDEEGPGAVLSSYWAMRYYGLLAAPDATATTNVGGVSSHSNAGTLFADA